jgi:hypothetical protein
MTVAPARFDVRREVIVVGDEDGELWPGEMGGLTGARSAVSRASLAEVRRAVRRADHYLGLGDEVVIRLYHAAESDLRLDEAAFVEPPFEVTMLPDRSLITCTVVADVGTTFDRYELTEQLRSVLLRHRLAVVELSVHDEISLTVAHLTCEVRARGATLGDAVAAAEDVLALWDATLGGGLTAATALDLMRSGRPDLLIGEPESVWLEVKGAPYRLQDQDQELELGKDVSALGNVAGGGVLVIGLATSRRDGVDVVNKVRPVPMHLLDAGKYRKVIDRVVYPPPEGLEVDAVELEPGKGLLVINIPPQPVEVLPLLVVGVVAGTKFVGSHVSIVRRRGDGTIATHPAALHSLIAAGRAALGGFRPAAVHGADEDEPN